MEADWVCAAEPLPPSACWRQQKQLAPRSECRCLDSGYPEQEEAEEKHRLFQYEYFKHIPISTLVFLSIHTQISDFCLTEDVTDVSPRWRQ